LICCLLRQSTCFGDLPLEPVGSLDEPRRDALFAPLDVELPAHDFIDLAEARKQFNLSGSGMAAVVIDSGINLEHRVLREALIKEAASADEVIGLDLTANGVGADIKDYDGHGSAVASILAGRETAFSSVARGIAHDAKIIPIKVYRLRDDPLDSGDRWKRVNQGLQWVLDNRQAIYDEQRDQRIRIGVVNISLGMNHNFPDMDGFEKHPVAPVAAETRRLISALKRLGVVVVVASGNNYMRHACKQGMDFPAFCEDAVSVGSVFDRDFDWTEPPFPGQKEYGDGSKVFRAIAGRCAPYSQRLAFTPLFHGTHLFAPGNDVPAACKYRARLKPGQSNASDIVTESGTSRAAPCVAATVLLLQQYFVDRYGLTTAELPNADAVINAMLRGGKPLTDAEEDEEMPFDNVTSMGEDFYSLNVLGALESFERKVKSEELLERGRIAELGNHVDAAGQPLPMTIMGVEVKIR
jgi:subtilisin family serine protease